MHMSASQTIVITGQVEWKRLSFVQKYCSRKLPEEDTHKKMVLCNEGEGATSKKTTKKTKQKSTA